MGATDEPEIIDAQVHLFGDDDPEYPWDPAVLADPALEAMRTRFREHLAQGSTEAMLGLMDSEGVHGALVVSPSIYGYDNSYSVAAWDQHPDRFRVVGRVDSAAPDVEDVLAQWGAHPAYVGLRVNLWAPAAVARFAAGDDDRMLAAAGRAGLRVCVKCPRTLRPSRRDRTAVPGTAADHRSPRAVRDPDARPRLRRTFAKLDGLLGLARFEQVAVSSRRCRSCRASRFPTTTSGLTWSA